MKILLFDEELILLPQKAIYFPGSKTLLAADIHLGKTAHFRQAGIPVPSQLARADLDELIKILELIDIERFIILGDLFHAKINLDWTIFREWRNNYTQLEIELVKGNHDVLHNSYYEELGITSRKNFTFSNILLEHNPFSKTETEYKYKLCGHVHPAVRLRGNGRQGVTLPCFYFGEKVGILPAFGEFTGRYVISPNENSKVFVITEKGGAKKVMNVS